MSWARRCARPAATDSSTMSRTAEKTASSPMETSSISEDSEPGYGRGNHLDPDREESQHHQGDLGERADGLRRSPSTATP